MYYIKLSFSLELCFKFNLHIGQRTKTNSPRLMIMLVSKLIAWTEVSVFKLLNSVKGISISCYVKKYNEYTHHVGMFQIINEKLFMWESWKNGQILYRFESRTNYELPIKNKWGHKTMDVWTICPFKNWPIFRLTWNCNVFQ